MNSHSHDVENNARHCGWHTGAIDYRAGISKRCPGAGFFAVEQDDVIDFASAIYHLRKNPPTEPTRFTIWNQGKTYPVQVRPLKPERRKVSGTKTEAQGYEISGVKVDGEAAFKERFTLYFARDGSSTPLEITGKRGWVKLRIQLVEEHVERLNSRP